MDGSTMQSKPGISGQQQSQPSEAQVQNFYDQLQRTMRQAVRNQNFQQATQFLRRHLAEEATFVSTNSISLNGRQVATATVMLDDDTLSRVLGIAAGSSMHSGARHNIQNYRLQIDVRDVQPIRGENAVRATIVMRESGQFRPGQDAVSGLGTQGRGQQAQLDDDSQPMQPQRQRGQSMAQDQDGSGAQGGITRGLSSAQLQYQSTAQCDQVLRFGPDGQIRIGSTLCHNNVQLDS